MKLPDRLAGFNTFEIMAGCLVLAVGAFVLWESSNYSLGTTRSMGPGFFPRMIGIALLVFGAGIIFVEGRRNAVTEHAAFLARPLLAILLAIGAFAVTIERFGLVPAVMLAVLISSTAERGPRLGRSLALAAGLAAATALIFPIALRVQVEILTW